ncbi:MAG: SHOCT domain-containing protein [Actinomycetota bacterium]
MKDIRIDTDGTPRCWNCGSKGLTSKRTFRSKAMVGVGALVTKKKLKCQRCGEYNDTGSGKPYEGPKARKYRKEWEAEKAEREAGSGQQVQSKASQLESLASLHAEGALTDEEFAKAKNELLSGD